MHVGRNEAVAWPSGSHGDEAARVALSQNPSLQHQTARALCNKQHHEPLAAVIPLFANTPSPPAGIVYWNCYRWIFTGRAPAAGTSSSWRYLRRQTSAPRSSSTTAAVLVRTISPPFLLALSGNLPSQISSHHASRGRLHALHPNPAPLLTHELQ